MEKVEKEPTENKFGSGFQLKNIYSKNFLDQVADEVSEIEKSFDRAAFLALVFDSTWPSLELKQRTRHISEAFKTTLGGSDRGIEILKKTAEKMVARDGERMALEWMIFPDFVEAFGLEDFEKSVAALESMTRLASAEFAVRPFLVRFPEKMQQKMLDWAKNPSAMVRRLASEGFRTRLPWGAGVPSLKKNPEPILPVLELLKNDEAETVRRSVANSLNDLSKDFPALALEISKRWAGQNAELDWVVRHGLRGLLKKGNAEALGLFGFEKGATQSQIFDFRCDEKVVLGGRLAFAFSIKNDGSKSEKLRLEYAIDFQNLSGSGSRKVFKINELSLAAGEKRAFEKGQSFQDFTTRKHFAGPHRLEILVNGEAVALADFQVF